MTLDWPAGLERTDPQDRKKKYSFKASLGSTTKDIEREMGRLDPDEWRAEIANQHTKSNGLPLHNAKPDDPGFVLRWVKDDEQFAVACDAYSRLRDNARAVYLWVNETRMRGQRPVVTGEDEFAAARLPPGDPDAVTMRPAHEVLGVAEDADESVIKAAARAKKAGLHPDNEDGDAEEFKRVVKAEEVMLDG